MKDLAIWFIHTPAGTIGLIAAIVALFAKKGAVLHRKAGTWFTVSMLIMLLSGFAAAVLKESPGDMFLSAVVFYTVFTAWLTTHHKKNEIGVLEKIALVWILTVAVAGFSMSFGWREVSDPSPYLFWAGFAVLCAFGDIHNLRRVGISRVQRIIRHVWRIGFSLIWAALAFTDKIVKIQGYNVREMPKEQLLVTVGAPTILILILTLYWIINILFFSRQKFAHYGD